MTAPLEVNLLRLIPHPSPVHRLWAGTKLACLVALTVAVSISPSWWSQAMMFAVIGGGVLVARIPVRAAPRLPRWFWLGLLIAGVLSSLAGGSPHGLGGLLEWARATALTLLPALGAALIGWTTPLAELGPALAVLMRPLAWLRVPVNEIVTGVALSVRCLPLLFDEMRVLQAARRVRRPVAPRGLKARLLDLHDLLVTALVTSVRRAREMGEAIDARGGYGEVARAHVVLGAGDLAVLAVTAAACAAMIAAL